MLVHQLLAYDPTLPQAYLTNRFVDGLRWDIRAVVIVHRPNDLDTASSLALLQEDALQISVKKEWKKSDQYQVGNSSQQSNATKHNVKVGALPLPEPPNTSVAKMATTAGSLGNSSSKKLEDKMTAMKAYRRANGLCFKCGEKWSPHNHTCAQAVPLHLVEEVWALLADIEGEEVRESVKNCFQGNFTSEQLLSISRQAVNGDEAKKTIRLKGNLGNQEVIMLIDSGSSTSFVSSQLVHRLAGVQPLEQPVVVKIADGGTMSCSEQVKSCSWYYQEQTFQTDFKVLPLACYDVILGMDWLEEHSPMKINWKLKHVAFEHKGSEIMLQVLLPDTQQCSIISVQQLDALFKQDAVLQIFELGIQSDHKLQEDIPPSIQSLINEFADLFAEPAGLPPKRAYDHTIPLLAGAQPFRLRPYRYTPDQKDEIEKQVEEMLKSGVIQHSSSPFASHVLLVRKKDMTWRLCVDYRRLNAYTVKNKYPLPIFDEIVDELSGAALFTKLDHKSGYHQIRMKEGEEYKTAFQTHHGHYEYKVMSYGLTGAPATFQSVMNTVLKPLLRKCVVVFIDDILVYSRNMDEHLQHRRQVFILLKQH